MIDDPLSVRLEEAARAAVPLRLDSMDDAILARMAVIRAERQQAALFGSGVAVAVFALTLGLLGAALPAGNGSGNVFDPGLAYAPSTLLGSRG